MIYYEGSKLRVEWTNQHACGDDPTTFCTMVLQYACEDTLAHVRDGYPSGDLQDADANNANYSPKYMKASFQRNNGDGTTTIPTDAQSASDTEYGMHESFEYYTKCSNVERNHGLYIADRNLGCDARSTRQQPNGARYGYECNEERDYYPYWNPSPWRDIAVLTTDPAWCSYYRENSENVKDRFECVNADVQKTPHKKIPINELNCTWCSSAVFERENITFSQFTYSEDSLVSLTQHILVTQLYPSVVALIPLEHRYVCGWYVASFQGVW